jgi:hypothetical protein
MPVTKLPMPQMGASVEELTTLMFRYYRELEYLLNGNLDSDNVKSITTDLLIAGMAKISVALIDDLVVGNNVTMGPNAYISWDNVTGAPDIPDDAHITTITANYVATPNLYTQIGTVYDTLHLGSVDNPGQLVFQTGANIYSEDHPSGPWMYFMADECVFPFEVYFLHNVSFSSGVDFTGATVTGLNVIAKFG